MRIPMGNFGNATPAAEQGRVITPSPQLVDGGAQQLAGAIASIGADYISQTARENEALARVRASNLLLDRETQLRTITTDLAEKARTGALRHDQLQPAYEDAASKLEAVAPQGLGPVEMENFGLLLKQVQLKELGNVEKMVGVTRVGEAQSDLASRMDLLGKDAGMPGADPDAIVRRMDTEDIDVTGRMAYGLDWDSKKQDFKDSVYSINATQRMAMARDDVGSLEKLQHDLTAEDGFYAGRLDANKRNEVLNSVTGRILQVKEFHQQQAIQREMHGMRVLDQMDKQAASGIPPTPADQQRWRAALSGTSMAGEYNTRVEQMIEVQGLRRLPFTEQQQYVDRKRQQLIAGGGSVDEAANLNRLQSMIDGNIKLAKDDPLTFYSLNTGTNIEPLNLIGITKPEGQMALVEQIGSRFDTVNAMRKQFGPEVARTPFMAQEKAMLKSFIDQVDDGTKLQVLGALAQSTSSGSDFAGAVKAIAADDPPLMAAAMAQASGLKGPKGEDVATVVLQGRRVFADKSTVMPKDSEFEDAFVKAVGDAIPTGSEERGNAFTLFKNIYAGLAQSSGVLHDNAGTNGSDIDDELAARAVELATGGVSEIGGGWASSGTKVIRPYGMSDDKFKDAIGAQISALSTGSGIPEGMLKNLPLMPVPGTEGQYFLLSGGRPQPNPKTGKALIVNVGGGQ